VAGAVVVVVVVADVAVVDEVGEDVVGEDVAGVVVPGAGGVLVVFVDEVGGAPVTVRAVVHASLVPQLALCGAAAVVTFVPSGVVASMTTWKDAVASEVGVPGAPSAGIVQVSVLAFGSIVILCAARSASAVTTLACPSSPERSSTTVPPGGSATRLLAVSV
jgi:hypothetical protein